MEHESFEDPETARFMNEHFVPVKVDREERPDVDSIYMEAVQGMTGHGGWPLTAFCDPEGVPFYGGTYFPPEPRHGMPSFRMVMEAVVESWAGQRERIRESAGRIRTQLAGVARIEPSTELLSDEIVGAAVEQLRSAADMRNGGFGGAPKFPPASALELLLTRGRTDVVEVTLDAMAAGGIHDQIGGGFARYSVDAVWLVPHFEKMLYDNALLARAYLHGYEATRSRALAGDLRADPGLDARRDAGRRGRLLLGPRRRLGGRGGAVLRLDAGRDPRGARRDRPRRDGRRCHRPLRGHGAGQLRGPQRPPPARRRGRRAAAAAR